ncbi:DUF3089 domain-containing protein [Gordonia neofelifaecis]|uniref:DUF3089 domain-containing protein n=1 Tax=Gordonia neofelifaecis NRRL B-59395 TaxID=644548 RepID=F1YFJ9_9ACTN|nr:DUF3089 domain-containing protein [Gordonia neofelifaecis]EGD56383.1 hypothetical protein SCNU_02482 [Gordonia neofelifaecis NRRL B-59395]
MIGSILRRAVVGLLATTAMVAGATVIAPDSSARPQGGTEWLCHPGLKHDPCDLPNDTTDVGTGVTTPATKVADSDRKVDCFYVYPTVTDQPSFIADRRPAPPVESIARFQAARFNSQCRVFAPVYRQMTLWGLSPAAMASWVGNRDLPNIGYGDVLRAWRDYLRNDNHGRGVIFIGHSQGTMMLRKLLREQVDPDPAMRSRVVGAFLLGGNVMTARGRTTGGDFRHLPVCTRRGEYGCVTAYSTELIGLPSLFGNASLDALSTPMNLPTGPAYQVACTDPTTLSGERRPVGATVPSKPYAMSLIAILMKYTTFPQDLPTSSSTWTTGPGRATVKCTDTLGFHRLHITMVKPQQVNELPLFDTHLLDVNLGLDRLVDIARQQIAAYGER